MGDPGDEEVGSHVWADELLAGKTTDQMADLAKAVGSNQNEEDGRPPVAAGNGSSIGETEGRQEAREPARELLLDTEGDGVPLGPAAAVRLHLSAGDVESLVERIDDAIERGERIDPGTWLAAGRFLSEMGRVTKARECLSRATGARPGWDRAASAALERQGDHREAARAMVATEIPTRSAALRRIGALYLADGDDSQAAEWLERAVDASPADPKARAALLEVASRTHDEERVDRIRQGAGDVDPTAEGAVEWFLALAQAMRRRGDTEAALDAVDRALEAAAASADLAPALLLFDLGREAHRDDWIDRALREVRSRAIELGDSARAFVSAALLVARGTASEDDRLTYRCMRVDLTSAPKGPLPTGWADRWLVQLAVTLTPKVEVTFDASRARDVDLEAGLLDALEAAQAVFGIRNVRVAVLSGDGPPVAVWDDPPRVGFDDQTLFRSSPRSFRFALGRALAALVDPRLRAGLADGSVAAEGSSILLDRAGLLVAQDPVVALEVIGPRTPRGRRLTAFALSDELFGLSARLGLLR